MGFLKRLFTTRRERESDKEHEKLVARMKAEIAFMDSQIEILETIKDHQETTTEKGSL